jgi:hypothetical protein
LRLLVRGKQFREAEELALKLIAKAGARGDRSVRGANGGHFPAMIGTRSHRKNSFIRRERDHHRDGVVAIIEVSDR